MFKIAALTFAFILMTACSIQDVSRSSLNELKFTDICHDAALAKYKERIQLIVGANSSWKSTFPLSNARFFVRNRDREGALAFGYSVEQLSAEGIPARICDNAPNYIAVDVNVPYPQENGVFAIVDGTNPFLFDYYSTLGYGTFAKLSRSTGLPLATLDLPMATDFPDVPDDWQAWFQDYVAHIEDEAAMLLVHELFHAYQANKNWKELAIGSPREIAVECLNNADWKANFRKEMDIWQKVGTKIQSLSLEEAQSIARQVIKGRSDSSDAGAALCWKKYGYWERIEGTARYFEVASGMSSRTYSDTRDAARIRLEADFNARSVEEDWEPFYFTGDMLSRLLARLASDSVWQTEVEDGELLSDTLSKITSATGHRGTD